MKVLWVEDHPRAGELLAAAAAAASRKRFGIDLVVATSLMDAERKLRLERFEQHPRVFVLAQVDFELLVLGFR